MVFTIDDMDVPRKRSVSPVLSRPPVVPPGGDDDSSKLSGEGDDTFEVAAGEDSKVVMTIDDFDFPGIRTNSTSPPRPRPSPAVDDISSSLHGEDSKTAMTIDEIMDISRLPSAAMSSIRSNPPPPPSLPPPPSDDDDSSSTFPDYPMTIDQMDVPRKPSAMTHTRTRSPPRTMTIDEMDIPRKPSSIRSKKQSASPPRYRSPPRRVQSIDEMDIPRKPSSSTRIRGTRPNKQRSTSPHHSHRYRSPPRSQEFQDDVSSMSMTIDSRTIPRKPSSSTRLRGTRPNKKRSTSPHRPQTPPPPPPEFKDDDSSTLPEKPSSRRELNDDDSSTLPEIPMTKDDDKDIPRKPSSSKRIGGNTSPARKRNPSPPRSNWGFKPNIRPAPPRELQDDDSSTLPGKDEDSFDVSKIKDNIDGKVALQKKNKKEDRDLVSFSLSGGPLFSSSNSRSKYIDKYHDIAYDDVSELDASNLSGMDFAISEEFDNIPSLRSNNTGLAAQAVPLRRSQLEGEDGSGAFVGDGGSSAVAEAPEKKKKVFKLGGNRRASRLGKGNKSPKKSPKKTRYDDENNTLGGVDKTLEVTEAAAEPKKPRVFTLRGPRQSFLALRSKSNKADSRKGESSDDFDEEETDEFNLAPMTAEALARRRKQLEQEDDSSTLGGEGDTLEPAEAKPKRGMSKMVSFSLGGGAGSLMSKLSPKRKKKTLGGIKEGVSDDELSDDGGSGRKLSSISNSGGVDMTPTSPLQVSRRRKPRKREKRGGMVTTPSSMNLGEVMSNPFSAEDMEAVNRAHIRRGSVSSVVSASELSQETDLHRALADEDSTMDQITYLLESEPASASIHDKEGKLPLHIVSENEQLHLNLGGALDEFILEDLINRNRRALITPNYAGDFPFISGIREWVDNINEVAEVNIPDITVKEPRKKDPKPLGKRRMSLLGAFQAAPPEPDSDDSSELGLGMPANDMESQRKREEIMLDLAEHLIPWNVFIDDLALWSIDMLSMLIEREPLKAMWTIKIVDTVAGIPCFLKTVLLIDDDEQRKHVLQSRLLHEVMLHEKSMGPWLVYLITSDDEVAQDRAVMYLQLMTVIESQVAAGSRKTFSSRISGAFKTADNQFMERKDKVYTKAAQLPGIIPAFMQFNTDNFSRCSTTSIVQYILDKKLFEPKSLTVILFDVFFLTMAVVLYTLCSNEVFKLISNMRYSPMVIFEVNRTAYDMCENGTLTGDHHTCLFYREKQSNSNYNLGSISVFRPTFDCDMECQVCRGMNDFGGDESTGGSIMSYTGEETIDEESIFTCHAIGDRYPIDTFLIFCVMALSFNCLYFMSRSLAAWVRVPRKYLAAQFFFVFTLVDTVSIIFPVVMVAIFITYIYQTDKFTNLNDGIYVPHKIHDVWMKEAELLSAASAACVGFLYLKILMYFKVLNQYTATFIFALGEVVKDIFWFFWIMVVIIFAFSQMFYTTLSCSEGFCRGDIGPGESSYNHFSVSLLKTYSILLGEFDLDQYNSPFTTILFVLYTFSVVIVVLNFLIAIVGDSFDKSMVKIETHFGRARLMFMVELSAFQSFAKVPFRVKKQNYRRFLLGGNWKGCITYLVISAGLVAGFVMLVINKDLVTTSSTGVVTMIGITLGLMIFSPFIWKMGVVGFLVHSPILNPVRKTVGRMLIIFFRIIMGKSILSDRSDKEKKDWGGRLKHIVAAIDEKIRESESMTLNTIAANDEKQNRIIEKMELRMENLEEDVSDMKRMLIKIQNMLEERG